MRYTNLRPTPSGYRRELIFVLTNLTRAMTLCLVLVHILMCASLLMSLLRPYNPTDHQRMVIRNVKTARVALVHVPVPFHWIWHRCSTCCRGDTSVRDDTTKLWGSQSWWHSILLLCCCRHQSTVPAITATTTSTRGCIDKKNSKKKKKKIEAGIP